MSTVERYVRNYVRRKRLIEVASTLAWMVDLLSIWISFKGGHPIVAIAFGAAPAGCLFGFSLHLLFRRISVVRAAMEIESRIPAFDQRLITAVSIAQNSPLAEQLLEETWTIIHQNRGNPMVSIRKFFPPLIVGCGLLLVVRLHHIF